MLNFGQILRIGINFVGNLGNKRESFFIRIKKPPFGGFLKHCLKWLLRNRNVNLKIMLMGFDQVHLHLDLIQERYYALDSMVLSLHFYH